jgi:hypothetical protein
VNQEVAEARYLVPGDVGMTLGEFGRQPLDDLADDLVAADHALLNEFGRKKRLTPIRRKTLDAPDPLK